MENLDEIISEVTLALQEAVKQHGAEAVELGLLIYKLEAFKIIVLGVVGVILLITLLTSAFKVCKKISSARTYDKELPYVVGALICIIPIMLLIDTSLHILNVHAWAAVFGYPQVFIAAKALAAGGLL